MAARPDLVQTELFRVDGHDAALAIGFCIAIAHNAGQLLVAVAITETLEVAWYGVVLLIAGIVTGFFTGQCAQAVLNHMDKLKPKS